MRLDTTHLEELGLRTLPDADIFRMARERDRIVLTFDLDFADIAAATNANFPSVIVFRLRFGRSARVTERLSAVIALAEATLEKGALIVVEEARIRIRSLPIVDRS